MEFPSRHNKNKTSCCVFGCSSKSCRDDTVRFYSFPTANSNFVTIKNKFGEDEVIDRRLAWIKQLKIGNEITQSKRVCSLHFTKDDFLPSANPNRQRIHLKKVSVPSCNLPETSLSSFNQPNLSQIHSREERRRRRSFQKQSSAFMSRSETAVISNDDDKVENEFNEDESRAEFAAEDLSSVEVSGENEMKLSNKNITYGVKDFQDVAIQVKSDFLTPKFSSFIKNDQQLSTLTGLSNFNLLNTIEKLVIQVQSTYNMSHTSIKFDLRELIVMTFMKLKQNMSYATLAIFFNFSKQSYKEQIWKMIDVLCMALKPSIYWPTKENILKNIPLCFKNFEGVRVVVDCTEIKIQKPSKLCCQLQTYSYYKSTYTVKFMTGVTPAGLISFISPAYGGRVSDNIIH
ncbi:uncharacterized protein LOC141528072 [Cotesia typhae]|uniref:uncharacterized protein LOC141528072 n=1 Tax=Cotesia typhae TaxID=2053667 RepID=UPI003D68515C